MGYLNQSQSRAPRHGRKLFRASPISMGDVSLQSISNAAGQLAQLNTGGNATIAKGQGIVSSYVAPVLSGASSLYNIAKGATSSAPAAAPAITMAPVRFTKAGLPPQSATQASMFGGDIAGIPMPVVLIGGAGLAAILLLKKRK